MSASPQRRLKMNKDDLSLSQLVDSYQLFNRASGKSASFPPVNNPDGNYS